MSKSWGINWVGALPSELWGYPNLNSWNVSSNEQTNHQRWPQWQWSVIMVYVLWMMRNEVYRLKRWSSQLACLLEEKKWNSLSKEVPREDSIQVARAMYLEMITEQSPYWDSGQNCNLSSDKQDVWFLPSKLSLTCNRGVMGPSHCICFPFAFSLACYKALLEEMGTPPKYMFNVFQRHARFHSCCFSLLPNLLLTTTVLPRSFPKL